MPPRLYSRHSLCTAIPDVNGRLFLSDREPFRYRELADNATHLVSQGDSLWTIAARFYAGVDRPAGLWWVIADFQPDPVFDPTITLTPGTQIIVPSLRTVLTLIITESRRNEERA